MSTGNGPWTESSHTSRDFLLSVAKGQIEGHSLVHKFGANHDIDTASETVWSQGGTYAWQAAASTLKVSSSDGADTGAGTGARTVRLYGLNATYDEVTEDITLTGQTEVVSSTSYIRIHRMEVLTAGSGGANAGVVYAGTGTVTAGVPATVYSSIGVGENQSNQAFYTVPAGYTAYIFRFDGFINRITSAATATFVLKVRSFGGTFLQKGEFSASSTGSSHVAQNGSVLAIATEKSDIKIDCDTSTDNINVTASFDLVLVNNDYLPS